MTAPEEIFNQQVWEILQDIREESLAKETGKPIAYEFPHVVGVRIIPKERRRDIYYKLQEWRAIKVLSESPSDWRGSGGITVNYYEKKRKEYRAKQKKINVKIAKLNFADEEYYLTSEYLLKLASKAHKLFKSSELHERRQLLKMTLQNLELEGKKVRFDWIKPFDQVAFYASR